MKFTCAITVPEWSDIIDLVYDDPALWDYLIDALKMWVELGVAGFRCDVASVAPLDLAAGATVNCGHQARRALAGGERGVWQRIVGRRPLRSLTASHLLAIMLK